MAPTHTTVSAVETAIRQADVILNSIDNKIIIAYKSILQDRYERAASADKEYIAYQIAKVSALIAYKVDCQWHKRLQKEKHYDTTPN